MLSDHLHRVIQNRQVPQAQEVHLQQAQLFQGRHGVLGDHQIVVGRQGNILINRLSGDHHARSVGGGIAGHPLHLSGQVHQPTHPLISLVEIRKAFGQRQRLVQCHFQIKGHLLCDVVHLGIGHVQHPAHISNSSLGLHRAKGDNLGHVVLPILPGNIVNDLLSPANTEVNVNIRHGHPLWVQKPLEIEGVFDGVDVGDVQAVGYHRSCGRSPARPHGNPVGFGVSNEVRHNEEVIHKPHLPNHAHLHLQPVHKLLAALGITPGKALPAQLLKIGVSVSLSLRKLEFRQVMDAKLEVHMTHIRDLHSVVKGVRAIREQAAHLLLRLDVKLLSLKAHPAVVLHEFSHLDTH